MAKCVVCKGNGKCPGCKGNVMKSSSCACNFGRCSRCKGSGKDPQ